MDLCRFQSAILGRNTLYLNTDVLHKAFPSALPILEFLKTLDRDHRVPSSLGEPQKRKLGEFLAMLSVMYRAEANQPYKTYGFNGLGPEASRATFSFNNQSMTVEAYFRNVKKSPLQFPNLPVL